MVADSGASRGHERRFAAGDHLCRQGQPGELLVLRSGSVRVTRDLGDREVTLAVRGAGALVGEDALVTATHAATATALEATEALGLDGESLEAMVADGGEIAVRVVRALLDQLADAHDRIALLARPSAGRLGLAIARLAGAIGREDPEGTLVPRRLRELASDVGLDEAGLAEASKLLLREGLVRVKKHGIVVPSVERMYVFVKALDASTAEDEPRDPVRRHGA